MVLQSIQKKSFVRIKITKNAPSDMSLVQKKIMKRDGRFFLSFGDLMVGGLESGAPQRKFHLFSV